MNSVTNATRHWDLHRIQQIVKWVVYSLLIVNFGFYVWEDVDRAIHTLHADSTLFDWTSEFATTVDTFAWFALLFMFELETYVYEDHEWNKWLERAVRGVRLVCYAMLAHTVVAYADSVIDYTPTNPIESAASLCDLADQGQSFVFNLDYTEITSKTCGDLSSESSFFRLGDNPLVTTADGLALERNLAWADLVEAIVWLIIVLSIELVVRLQSRGVTGGAWVKSAYGSRMASYAILALLCVYWGFLGHGLYVWDNFLWVAGFAAIEMNVNEWREEILEGQGLADTIASGFE